MLGVRFVRGLSLVAASGGHFSSRCAGLSLSRPLLLWASHSRGLSCCGAQAPDAQAQQLWLTGLVAPRHVGSSQTRARTRVPCISRQTLNHCATREAPCPFLIRLLLLLFCFELYKFLNIFWILTLYQIYDLQIFSLIP